VALPEVIENKFDRKWGRKQEKKMAPIQEVREHTDEKNDSDEEFDSDEQPQILKQLRYLASFPEKIYIT
jgi:transcription elongation GreA/GreB family factor